MNLDKFTDRVKGFLQSAQTLAQNSNHQRLLPEHLLKVFLSDPQGLAANLIESAGGNIQLAQVEVESLLSKVPQVQGSGAEQIYMTPDLSKVLQAAEKAATKAGDSFVTLEYILLAMALESTLAVSKVFKAAGVTAQTLNTAIQNLRKGREAHSSSSEDTYDALKKYARDLTQAARDNKLDPVIGRDEEIRRTIQVLARRTKNNPV
ncbi:MAG: Clp protease N-terminal domain-containing protein, partial [Alphaproteobacteria bacterium]